MISVKRKSEALLRHSPRPPIHGATVRAAAAALLAAAGLVHCGPDYPDAANLDSRGSQIICFGDSITRGHGARVGMDYPAQLADLLGRPVLNKGRDGDTTASALQRLERDVLDEDPLLVVIELGGNDLFRRATVEETLQNLDRIVGSCVARGAMVVLLHARFGLLTDPYLDGCRAIAARHGAVLVPEVLDGILGNPKRMSDQVHPNDEGYGLLARRVAEVVERLLSRAKAHGGGAARGSTPTHWLSGGFRPCRAPEIDSLKKAMVT